MFPVFHWLFGLIRFRIDIPGTAKIVSRHPKRPPGKNINRKRGGTIRDIFALLQQSAFRRRSLRFINGLLHATRAQDLYLHLRIGLGDPADTGRLWGFLGPVAGMAADLSRAEVCFEPVFIAPALEVEGHGEFRLIPLQ